jgi:hypothetical protein
MTCIQQFIEKTLTGGWRPEEREVIVRGFYEHYFEYRVRSTNTGHGTGVPIQLQYEVVLLDPSAWQAVGQVERWYEGHYGPEWLHHMHKMIDALAEGKTIEAYLQEVLGKIHQAPVSLVSAKSGNFPPSKAVGGECETILSPPMPLHARGQMRRHRRLFPQCAFR